MLEFQRAHAVLGDALHAHQPHPEFILNEFAHGAHAAVAQVVDVVGQLLRSIEADDLADDAHQILHAEGAALGVLRHIHIEALV